MTINIKAVESLIIKALPDSKVEIEDIALDGKHFDAHITSDAFLGKSMIERHEMIHNILGSLVGNDIHALTMQTSTFTKDNSQVALGDFKPSEQFDSEILAQIDEVIKTHDVVLFMKGNKQSPMCGFSGTLCHILNTLGVSYTDINVLVSEEIRQGIKTYSNWPTIPQLYMKGHFIGGCDIVTELFQSGELKKKLTNLGIDLLP